jgi:hypothetical protein
MIAPDAAAGVKIIFWLARDYVQQIKLLGT